ncbi:ribosomal L7Ae/L30e/S12e/Gadd45 family protein [Tissierellaceae bacterium HCP3S3_D8]
MTIKLNSKNKVVGAKQVRRALSSSEIEAVYLANDADKKVVSDIIKLCEEKQIQMIHVDSMKKLGDACGIDINAAVAALLK